jgi:hypothetical protein
MLLISRIRSGIPENCTTSLAETRENEISWLGPSLYSSVYSQIKTNKRQDILHLDNSNSQINWIEQDTLLWRSILEHGDIHL